tara:strand:- start:291 stop:1325 length:1035 start_codon:yes stop_codon:yes gene_type:complete
MINACGEWDKFKEILDKNSIKIISLNISFYNFLPKTGFIQSRFSYIMIFLFCFFQLKKILKKDKPDLIICHLITSLPLVLLNIFKFKSDFILRISGYPKLHLIRKYFWKKSGQKLKFITCPTLELKKKLEKNNLFDKNKIKFLPDAILDISSFRKNIKETITDLPKDKKIILSAGRLTKQKNFIYLVKEFEKFSNINNDFILVILGDGEEKKKLEIQILKKNMKNKIFLKSFSNKIFSYMRKSEIFVLPSLWEEVGFVIVESALNNCYVISSDCPNGPTEFLNNGENGILFSSNKDGALLESFKRYLNFDEKKKFNDRVSLKKNTRKYTMFHHYLNLKKIINSI